MTHTRPHATTEDSLSDAILLIAVLATFVALLGVALSRHFAWVAAVDTCAIDIPGDPEAAWNHCAASTPHRD